METLGLLLAIKIVGLVVWFVIALIGVKLYKSVASRIEKNDTQDEPKAPFDVIFEIKWRLFCYFVLIVVMMYITSVATAYQPKTQPSQINYQLQQELNAVDSAEIVIPASKWDEKPSWEQEMAKSRKQNQASKEAFNKLPKAK